jgi:uncharacterized damage-inducible protein DinB
MDRVSHIRLLAKYNEWMNSRLYELAAQLRPEQLAEHRGAYFGSILGTLNHLMVGDIIWLKRFATHPGLHSALDGLRNAEHPSALDQILFNDFAELRVERECLDLVIIEWTGQLRDADLDHQLDYRNSKGMRSVRDFGALVLHLFNHQTHHRGQVTTLLSQEGYPLEPTDLLGLIPDKHDASTRY